MTPSGAMTSSAAARRPISAPPPRRRSAAPRPPLGALPARDPPTIRVYRGSKPPPPPAPHARLPQPILPSAASARPTSQPPASPPLSPDSPPPRLSLHRLPRPAPAPVVALVALLGSSRLRRLPVAPSSGCGSVKAVPPSSCAAVVAAESARRGRGRARSSAAANQASPLGSAIACRSFS